MTSLIRALKTTRNVLSSYMHPNNSTEASAPAAESQVRRDPMIVNRTLADIQKFYKGRFTIFSTSLNNYYTNGQTRKTDIVAHVKFLMDSEIANNPNDNREAREKLVSELDSFLSTPLNEGNNKEAAIERIMGIVQKIAPALFIYGKIEEEQKNGGLQIIENYARA
jgi:hypothetical protein